MPYVASVLSAEVDIEDQAHVEEVAVKNTAALEVRGGQSEFFDDRHAFGPSVIEAGMALRGKNHMRMAVVVHSMAYTPPPMALNASPELLGVSVTTVHPVMPPLIWPISQGICNEAH